MYWSTLFVSANFAHAKDAEQLNSAPVTNPAGPSTAPTFFIREYRVRGAKKFPHVAVEEAVYPFLGPGRTAADVESARSSLENAYREKGYQAVSVQVPEQSVDTGIIYLEVAEGVVGKLRVKGARYFSPAIVKAQAPSMAEGTVLNFNEVTKDIVALNQLPERQVTPSLHASASPGKVDVDLEVKDKPPVGGSLGINNQHGPNTEPLRVNGSFSATNLWQLGHALTLGFQVAPQDVSDEKIFTGSYLVRFANTQDVSLLFQGSKQDSDVSTLGGVTVVGRGETLGARVLFKLPPVGTHFFHSAGVGLDYKQYVDKTVIGETESETPRTIYPLSGNYSATLLGDTFSTVASASVNLHFRGTGKADEQLSDSRHGADDGYIYLRGDIVHTQRLPWGLELGAEGQGQLASGPLVSSEQFSVGGEGTVRGYLAGERSGDAGLVGSLELRSPSLFGAANLEKQEWRFYAFGDGAMLVLRDPLPEEKSRFELASYGIGTRFRWRDRMMGDVNVAVPLIDQQPTKENEIRVNFRAGVEF